MTQVTASWDDAKWQLVPREPTKNMEVAELEAWVENDDFANCYKAMLAAAPDAGSGWQTMETCPLDCDSLLLDRIGGIALACWGEYNVHNAPHYVAWMPAPQPQKESGT